MKLWSLGFSVVLGVLGPMTACGNAEPGSGAPQGGSGGSGASPAAGGDAEGEAAGTSGGGTSSSGSGGGAGTPGEGGAPASAGDGAGGAPLVPSEPLLPWAIGNAWTYRVTKNGTVTEKTTTVGALETVGGSGPSAKLKANHVTTAKGAGSNDHTESWQAPDDQNPERIVRFRELTYDPASGMLQDEVYCDPPKLHVDGSPAHTLKGATWKEQYLESTLTVGMPVTSHSVSETWSVVADDETLKVPAGTFLHVVHFRKVGAASTKDYWYARGVGKLKETGTQTEELSAYSLK
jgi:hypothetical protein